MPACDDLYHAAALNSQYELFAASCGNRVGTNNDYAYAGFCESLDV